MCASTAVWYPQPVPTSSTASRSRPLRASSLIRATTHGCEIVCPWPIGSGASSYARIASASSTKMWRGTAVSAASTTSSRIPCSRRRSTIRARVRADVMPIPVRRVSSPSVPIARLPVV